MLNADLGVARGGEPGGETGARMMDYRVLLRVGITGRAIGASVQRSGRPGR